MKTAVPGEIVYAGRCFEERDRRIIGWRLFASNGSRYRGNFEIIEPADQTAFDALREEFVEHDFPQSYQQMATPKITSYLESPALFP
jgi:hypothetical protein